MLTRQEFNSILETEKVLESDETEPTFSVYLETSGEFVLLRKTAHIETARRLKRFYAKESKPVIVLAE